MLNEKDLSRILKVAIPPLTISDIHWKAQDSDKHSVLFYKILSDEKSQKLFTERIDKAQFGWLILNCDHPSRPMNSTVASEKEWPEIQKQILDIIYPQPKIKLLAVTGTNGKTTTADLILQIGELCGKKGLSIGTLGVRENHKTILDFGLTSPSLIDLRKFLFKYGQDKDFCILEASSHALEQERLYGLKFDMAGWLSFSQDHLDYHHTMEDYFAAKILLTKYLTHDGLVYVPSEQQDLFERISKVTSKVKKAESIDSNLPIFFNASFNRNNLEVAVSIIEKTFLIKVPDVFHHIIPPDGRFFIREYKTSFIVVDFAHSPDALENICRSIRESFPNHTLKVLFGCGGDRDRLKRSLMGKVADAWADEIYLTSDNPRGEEPEQIIEDIAKGIHSKKVTKVVDRKQAVQSAFSELKENEVLLLAGKGHENFILSKGVKYPYSDITEVEEFLVRKS